MVMEGEKVFISLVKAERDGGLIRRLKAGGFLRRNGSSFIRDDRGVTTVEWVVMTGIVVLIIAAAARTLVDKGQTEAGEIETQTDTIFGQLLPGP